MLILHAAHEVGLSLPLIGISFAPLLLTGMNSGSVKRVTAR